MAFSPDMIGMGQLVDRFSIDPEILMVYAPIGVVGLWRWSVWIFKKIVSFFYKTPLGDGTPTVSVVTPVYNEDPDIFLRALDSWKANKPQEIIAVIDSTDLACIEVFKKFKKNCSGSKLIITEKPGKREALEDGVNESSSETVILVDSDTVWESDLKDKLTRPFSDYMVGGVAPVQDVMAPKTLAQRLFQIHLFNRYGCEIVAQATAGTAISCISGRTAAYRRNAVAHLMRELVGETFLGKKCISGDDKRLTHLIQRDGWIVRYINDARVYTPGFRKLSSYVKQQIRWTRNSWRADLKALFSGWMWKHPFLVFSTIDRFIQPFTLLLGPAFFIVSLVRGDWMISGTLLLWWMIGRGIKVYPHLRKHPRDILILPVYTFFCFLVAVIKIFTLLTVDEQSWITRWSADRINAKKIFEKVPPVLATFCIVTLLFYISYQSSGEAHTSRDQKERSKEVARMWKTDKTSGFMTLSQDDALFKRDVLQSKIDSDPFVYYRVVRDDTLNKIRNKYSIARNVEILNEDGTSIQNPDIISLGQRLAFSVQGLLNPDFEFVNDTTPKIFPRVYIDTYEDAIRVKGNSATITIPEIADLLGDTSIVERGYGNEWLLRKNLYIDKGVTLIIDGTQVSWLKLLSGASGFVWLKSENGNIVISDTKITSWDEEKGDFDREWKDGRSYILQKSNGRMDIRNSEIAYLGYLGFPKRGNPFGGPYGISWKIRNDTFRDELSTGSLINNRIHHNYFGVYTYGASGIVMSGNSVYENVEYGIDPHDDSNHFIIENNQTFRNGKHGIIVSRRCVANIIRNNDSYDNELHGIMLDRDSNGNIVENNRLSRNTNGLAVYGSSGNIISSNRIFGNKFGIRANHFSTGNIISNNSIESSEKGIFLYQGSRDNYLFENDFIGTRRSVQIKDDSNTHLTEKSPVFDGVRKSSATGLYLDF